jgi:hypothetical protein
MRTVDEIFEEAKRLPEKDLQRLRAKLADIEGTPSPPPENELADGDVPGGRYARLLAMSGAAHSDFTDVSRQKGKHLAEVYAPKREAE